MSDQATPKIVFNAPGPDTPGYLRRMKKALEMKQIIDAKNLSPAMLEAIVEFFLPYIGEPKDRSQAKELLWDASENDFNTMLAAVTGDLTKGNPTRSNGTKSTDI